MSKMKRSRQLALTTLMATASVHLTACNQQAPEALTWDQPAQTNTGARAANDEAVEALAYSDVASCKAADEIPDAECDTGWLNAQNDHAANAPRYGDKTACEAEYGEGQCETRSGGGFFTPFLAGMLVGQLAGGGRGYRGAGLYQNRVGQLNPAGGPGALSRNPATGRLQVARSTFDPGASARPAPSRVGDNRAVSRGGFRSTRTYAGGRSYGG